MNYGWDNNSYCQKSSNVLCALVFFKTSVFTVYQLRKIYILLAFCNLSNLELDY